MAPVHYGDVLKTKAGLLSAYKSVLDTCTSEGFVSVAMPVLGWVRYTHFIEYSTHIDSFYNILSVSLCPKLIYL